MLVYHGFNGIAERVYSRGGGGRDFLNGRGCGPGRLLLLFAEPGLMSWLPTGVAVTIEPAGLVHVHSVRVLRGRCRCTRNVTAP